MRVRKLTAEWGVGLALAALALVQCSDEADSNHPPAAPNTPSPADGATGVSLTPTLTWACADEDGDALTYDVYFGREVPPPKVATGLTARSYTPEPLVGGVTYFWKIAASDGKATTAGPLWCFTTAGGGGEPYCHYLPLHVGNNWTYHVTDASMHNPTEQYDLRYEVTERKESYNGLPLAYVIVISRDGVAQSQLVAGLNASASCSLESGGWLYLIRDAMPVGEQNETGLVAAGVQLIHVGATGVTVPAGTFADCRNLRLHGDGNWGAHTYYDEYYAADAGLVKYVYDWSVSSFQMPHITTDWRKITYELTSYEIIPPSGR